MGKLVQFNKHGRSEKPRVEPSVTGKIVLFTGVRYEREDAPLPSKPAGAASGGKGRRA